jgi:hypothetical protein
MRRIKAAVLVFFTDKMKDLLYALLYIHNIYSRITGDSSSNDDKVNDDKVNDDKVNDLFANFLRDYRYKSRYKNVPRTGLKPVTSIVHTFGKAIKNVSSASKDLIQATRLDAKLDAILVYLFTITEHLKLKSSASKYIELFELVNTFKSNRYLNFGELSDTTLTDGGTGIKYDEGAAKLSTDIWESVRQDLPYHGLAGAIIIALVAAYGITATTGPIIIILGAICGSKAYKTVKNIDRHYSSYEIDIHGTGKIKNKGLEMYGTPYRICSFFLNLVKIPDNLLDITVKTVEVTTKVSLYVFLNLVIKLLKSSGGNIIVDRKSVV